MTGLETAFYRAADRLHRGGHVPSVLDAGVDPAALFGCRPYLGIDLCAVPPRRPFPAQSNTALY